MSRKPTAAIKSSVATKSKVSTPSAPAIQPVSQTTPATASPPLLDKGGEKDVVFPAGASLQQRRAAFALYWIKNLAGEWKEDTKKQKEFNSYASAMPFMIHANGLGQTAAFYRRKGTDHSYYRLYKLLGNWLSQADQPFAGKTDLLEGITQSDMDAYLAAQAEAMLFLDWVKKLASAFLARDEESI